MLSKKVHEIQSLTCNGSACTTCTFKFPSAATLTWMFSLFSKQLSRALLPHLPFGAMLSAGQDDEFPVQNSGVSHLASIDGRHIWVEGAKEHWSVQHGLLRGSQEAFDSNLQVVELQQADSIPTPGSHSSPRSTMPLPHILN